MKSERKNAFNVPDGYFKKMQNEVFKQINEVEDVVQQKPSLSWLSLSPFRIGISFGFIAILALFFILNGLNEKQNSLVFELTWEHSELDATDLWAYLETNELDFTEEEIAHLGAEELSILWLTDNEQILEEMLNQADFYNETIYDYL